MRELKQFHDGYFEGAVVRDMVATLFISTVEKKDYVIRLEGVRSLKLEGFSGGNIIFDVALRTSSDVTSQDMVSFFGYRDETAAEAKLEEVQREQLLVLDITPTYGATCSVLAKSAVLRGREEGIRDLLGSFD